MIGIDKEGLPDEEPERSEGNRPQSEYCILATANQAKRRYKTKPAAKHHFASRFWSVSEVILTDNANKKKVLRRFVTELHRKNRKIEIRN